MATAFALSLAFAATASASSNTTDFEDFTLGSVGGQGGWKADDTLDQSVIDVPGGKALRISNAVTSGAFNSMPYSQPVEPAGEDVRSNVLTNEFTFQSATPDAMQPGLAMSISPTNGEGARMSYVRLEDRLDGVRVFFNETPNQTDAAAFTSRWIATLDRSVPHTIKFETTFVKGNDNDIVRVSIDGDQAVCGTSWENYYRFSEQNPVAPSDRLMWRLSTAPSDVSKVDGKGFVFDNVSSSSDVTSDPEVCGLPVGPAGATGTDGANGASGVNGVNGVDGVATVIHDHVKLSGATIRTLHAQSIKGNKFISVRASLRGKRVPTHGRTIKVDLRGKTVGNYNVGMVAKYKAKGGKVHTVRSVRALSISR
jgi:hypothetical protein